MFYRVDYLLAVMLAGTVLGALLARRTSGLEASRLAHSYYLLIAVRVVLGAVVFFCTILLPNGRLWSTLSGGLGDASNFLFAALIGLALFRVERLDLLREPAVYSAFCLSTGFGFVTAGLAKPFYMQNMIEFFAQSGYPLAFLKFIVIAEVLGGAALMIPWMVIPVIAGFSIDMVGAIYTHVHNGDPLSDSTGAIGMLIRLVAIAWVWAMRSPAQTSPRLLYRRLTYVGAGGVFCLVFAVAGSALLRRAPAATPIAESKPSQSGSMDYFVGSWHCAGTFARSGAVIEADLHFEKALDGRWLTFRHDDRPPNSYHALAEWSQNGSEWTASIQDSFGGLRLFRSRGWEGPRLIWEGDSLTTEGPNPKQHFIFERTDPSLFELSYEVQQTSGSWRLVDSSACTRAAG